MKPLFFILLCCIAVQSQTITKYSASFKGTTDIFADRFEEGIELNAFSKTYVYTIGYYFAEDSEWYVDPSEKYKQLNFLFGKYEDSKNEKFHFQYQAGIGVFWGRFRTEVDEENSRCGFFKIFCNTAYFTRDSKETIALPLKIGGRYMPFPFLSIGIDILANINQQKTLLRPLLSIEIGKLRNK